MPFRMINNSKKECRVVSGPARREDLAARVMQGIIGRLGDVLPAGTETVDVSQVQLKLGERLEDLFFRLSQSDKDHTTELVDLRELRERRKQAADELYEKLVELRLTFHGQFGVGSSVKLFGLDDDIPTDPMSLHQLAELAHERLNDPGVVLPPQRLGGVTLDRQALAASWEPAMRELGEVLDEISRERMDSVDAQLEKNATIEEFQRLLGDGARLLEALYDFADMKEHSKRLRQSRHRARRAPEEPGGTPPPEDDEGAADALFAPAAAADDGDGEDGAAAPDAPAPASDA